MNTKTTEQQERASAEEWAFCLRHEAQAALILRGIQRPTERQLAAYILYGEKSLNRRKIWLSFT